MRTLPALASLAAIAAFAPNAHACTLQNCWEVRTAYASTPAGSTHAVAGSCAVTGKGGMSFELAGAATSAGAEPVGLLAVRCQVYSHGTLVRDRYASSNTALAAFTDTFTSGPDLVVCLTASGDWADGHFAVVTDCS